MFTKMRNLQKQIDIVIVLLTSERQKVQLNHGRHRKTQKVNQRSQAVKNHVQKQPEIPLNRHWKSRPINHSSHGKHWGLPKQLQDEPKPHAQSQNEKLRRQVQLLQETQRTQQTTQRPQTKQGQQNQDRRDPSHSEWHRLSPQEQTHKAYPQQQGKSQTDWQLSKKHESHRWGLQYHQGGHWFDWY